MRKSVRIAQSRTHEDDGLAAFIPVRRSICTCSSSWTIGVLGTTSKLSNEVAIARGDQVEKVCLAPVARAQSFFHTQDVPRTSAR